MKKITCTGYYGTGSSAITDLLSECNNVYSMGDYEFRFVHDPEGLSDLEYNLVENHNRHNSGHALKRYKKNVDFLSGNKLIKRYEPYFDYKFKEISYEYIESLTDFKFKGMWHQDIYDRGKLFFFCERFVNKIYMVLRKKLFGKTERAITFLSNEITYASRPKDKFYDATKEYTDKLLAIANREQKEYLMVDQIVPPSNISRYLRYFNDLKVVVVDRDPRDIYLLEKLYWKGTVVPHEDVELFCKWFKLTREHIKDETEDASKILRIKFEDLIYNYEETTNKVFEFLEIDSANHTAKKQFLDPAKSQKNTRLWEKHTSFSSEIKVIENQLAEYLSKY